MSPTEQAYQRAIKPVHEEPLAVWTIRLLSVAEALLCVALFVLAGLLVSLLVTRGITRIDRDAYRATPAWLQASLPVRPPSTAWVEDSGLSSIIMANQDAAAPARHRLVAGWLRRLVAAVPAFQSNRSALAVLIGALFTLLLIWLGLSIARRRLAVSLAASTAVRLRRQIHRHMYRLGQSALPSQGIGPVLNVFTREVNDIRDALVIQLEHHWTFVLLTVALAVLALWISPAMTLFLGALVGICLMVCRPLLRLARDETDTAARNAAMQLCLLHEDLGLTRTVRVFGTESTDKDRFDEHLGRFEQADRKRMFSEGSLHPIRLLVQGTGLAAGTAILGWLVFSGPYSLTAILMVAAAVYIIWRLVWAAIAWRRLAAVAARSASTVLEYLDRKPELTMGVGARFLPPLSDKIVFENVTVEDANRQPHLQSVSCEIPAGSRTAIVSLDENARLAMACLIPRLLDPTVGRVRIDGNDLRDVTLESLRAQVSTVLQADLIFTDTVRTNLTLGDASLTLPRVIQAAKLAHAHRFIQQLPDGYDTVIGPLGYYPTLDQQYRIALARAAMHDPSILIIEEPGAEIDAEVKPLIDDTIDRLARNRTLVFLPRRLSTVRRCDQVILIHEGRIVAAGSPREVAKQSKLFRNLQFSMFGKPVTSVVRPEPDAG